MKDTHLAQEHLSWLAGIVEFRRKGTYSQPCGVLRYHRYLLVQAKVRYSVRLANNCCLLSPQTNEQYGWTTQNVKKQRESISIDDQDKRVKIIRAKKKFPYEERFSSLDFLSLRESYVEIRQRPMESWLV